MKRRGFLWTVAGTALNLSRRHAVAANIPIQAKSNQLDVRSYGARGDGTVDDTAAIQAAINALPSMGGTVSVPEGTYLVDATKSLRLRSKLTLQLAPNAVLAAIPNAATNSAIIAGYSIADVTIEGGQLLGERQLHVGSKGEWGMGIDLRGCKVILIRGVSIRNCWGDGIYVGSSSPAGATDGACQDVTIRDCSISNNRRQGISIVHCTGARIEHCTISDTGGTNPQSGIDLEPDSGKRVEDITIIGNSLSRNAGSAIGLWGNLATRGIRLIANRTSGSGRVAIYVHDATGVEIFANHITERSKVSGIKIDGQSADVVIRNNICSAGASIYTAASVRRLVAQDNSCTPQ